jgi:hypothetical protein
MTLFNPLIQPSNVLSGVQKYLLRVVLGWAGKTVMHRERLVEVLETHDALCQLFPLMESDLSESNAKPFWIPRREIDRKRFNFERRDKSRRHRTIGVSWADSRPRYARSRPLRSRFPSVGFLHHLVSDLGYDKDAAFAALAQPRKMHGRPDRRRKKAVGGADEQAERQREQKTTRDYQRLDYGFNLYVPGALSRRTLTGGGFTRKQVSQGLLKMRTNSLMKAALNEIVYRHRSTLEVSNKTGIPVENLYVYASRLREHIRRESQAAAA